MVQIFKAYISIYRIKISNIDIRDSWSSRKERGANTQGVGESMRKWGNEHIVLTRNSPTYKIKMAEDGSSLRILTMSFG